GSPCSRTAARSTAPSRRCPPTPAAYTSWTSSPPARARPRPRRCSRCPRWTTIAHCPRVARAATARRTAGAGLRSAAPTRPPPGAASNRGQHAGLAADGRPGTLPTVPPLGGPGTVFTVQAHITVDLAATPLSGSSVTHGIVQGLAPLDIGTAGVIGVGGYNAA